MALAPATRLGPYEILQSIGAGGMGEVYRARDTRLERTVAVKILPPHLSSDPVRKQRFEREAKTISSLNHPHICTLYDVGQQDGVDYLVMECVEGETLSKRIEKGPLLLEQVLKFGAQIADALDKAHHAGIVHRDLKPGNIMLTSTGAKLLDFGLAKPAAPASAMTLTAAATQTTPVTQEGAVVGTFQYMSPEQIEGKELDARSDIFSLGAVLYEMLTGQRAFPGKSQLSVASAILEKEPAPVSSVKPLTPPALDHAIRRCLTKDPEERWQIARDLALELKWIAEVSSQTGVPATAAPRRKAGAWIAWASAAICFLAAVALAAVLWTRAPMPVQIARSSLLPPPGSSFLGYSFAISPDGTRLAFSALAPDGKTALWVRRLSASGAQQLSGTEGATSPFWSPDSRQIGFFAENRLKTVDVAGGAVQILCDSRFYFGGAWNREGTILFAPELDGPLYRVPATGGPPVPVTKPPSQGSIRAHRWPYFLPDGKHFLYSIDWRWSGAEEGQGNGIYVRSFDSDQSKLVLPEVTGNVLFASGHLLFVRDRNLMAQPFDTGRLLTTGPSVSIAEQAFEPQVATSQIGLSVSENGLLVFQSAADSPSRLVWYDRTGKDLGEFPEVGYRDPSFSPDGRFLAVSSDDERNGKRFIRVYDLKRGISTRLTDGGHEYFPIWSRDGKRIVYGAPAGTFPMYEVAADGSSPPQILLQGARGTPNDWSSDGNLVFMRVSEEGPYPSLEIYSLKDHQVTEFARQAVEAKLSPDGKWIAYVGAGVGVFVQPFPGLGAKIQISQGRGAQPRWSSDGRQIFYMQYDRKLMAVNFDPRNAQASAPRLLFQTRIVAPSLAAWQYDVAPDGRFLINSLPANTASPLTLITGWDASLRQR